MRLVLSNAEMAYSELPDNITPYTGGKNIQDVITSLENCALVLFK